jgi:hypothetical protein
LLVRQRIHRSSLVCTGATATVLLVSLLVLIPLVALPWTGRADALSAASSSSPLARSHAAGAASGADSGVALVTTADGRG